MISRRSVVNRSVQVGVNLLLYALGIACLFPLLWALSTAPKPENDALSSQFFVGLQHRWSNFASAWSFFPFGRFLVNSAVMALGGVLVVLVASTTGGYVFASRRFPAKERIFFVYIATMLIPASVTAIPLFLISRFLHLYDSYPGLIIPILFGALGTSPISTAPPSRGSSGRSCCPWSVPPPPCSASSPSSATEGNFIWPLVVTQSPDLSTLTVGLRSFQGQYGTCWSYMMAGSWSRSCPPSSSSSCSSAISCGGLPSPPSAVGSPRSATRW